MLKRIIHRLKSLLCCRSRDFHDHGESKKFNQQRPRDPIELAALYGMMR